MKTDDFKELMNSNDSGYCKDCGSKTYGGYCVYCDEDVFIDIQDANNDLTEEY